MGISPQFEVKQLVKQIGEGGGPLSTHFKDRPPKPLLPSVVWDRDKLGLRVLPITGIKIAPHALAAAFYEATLLTGDLRLARFPASGCRLKSAWLPLNFHSSGLHIRACIYFLKGCCRDCFLFS